MTHSGLCHNQISTLNNTTLTSNDNQSGALLNQINVALTNIIPDASHFARLGTAPCWRHCWSCGPNFGCASNQLSNCGQPLPAAKADSSTKGTVGKPGNSTPISPSAKLLRANSRQHKVRSISEPFGGFPHHQRRRDFGRDMAGAVAVIFNIHNDFGGGKLRHLPHRAADGG